MRLLTFATVSMEEIVNPQVEISDCPVRRRKILRTYDFILPKFHLLLPKFHLLLPKFHLLLPKFYFGPPWGNFVSSLTLPDFLGRDPNPRKCRRTHSLYFLFIVMCSSWSSIVMRHLCQPWLPVWDCWKSPRADLGRPDWVFYHKNRPLVGIVRLPLGFILPL